jgi:hypothetical protein
MDQVRTLRIVVASPSDVQAERDALPGICAELNRGMAALVDPHHTASEVARRLGLTRTTLYAYVNGDASVKEGGQRLLDAEQTNEPRKTRKTA